jgi:two-component system sensor histidine kinase ArlS
MKIRNKLTISFSTIVAIILIVFSLVIFFTSSSYRTKEFNSRLKENASSTADLLIVIDEVDSTLLNIIKKHSKGMLQDENVRIFDSSGKLIFETVKEDNHEFKPAIFDEIKKKKEIAFKEKGIDYIEYIGFVFYGKEKEFIIIASANNKHGIAKLNYLKWVLLISLTIGIVVTVFTGLFFSNRALEPIRNIINQIKTINALNLKKRIVKKKENDEVDQLADEFNGLLERLQLAFEMQQSFISNASHELRTPLTSIISQIEVSLMAAKADTVSNTVLYTILDEIKEMNKLINGLLGLANVQLDETLIEMKNIRVDNILAQAYADYQKKNPLFLVDIVFDEFPTEENWLMIHGNENLLKNAVLNLIDNAFKYSFNKKISIKVGFNDVSIFLKFIDSGIGIPSNELNSIFEPFFRATNASFTKGHGIGLSLTQKVIHMHRGEISVSSVVDKGSTIHISLPHLA